MTEKDPAASYETALQAVGAHLDSQCAVAFKLVETPKGFTVTFELPRGEPESRAAFFRFDDLHRSGVDIGFIHKVRPLPRAGDRQYRHLLGSIGHDLDAVHAMCILLDELPETMLITYEYDDPSRGYVLRKRMALAGPNDRERLLQDAQRRRSRLRPRSAAHWLPLTDTSLFY